MAMVIRRLTQSRIGSGWKPTGKSQTSASAYSAMTALDIQRVGNGQPNGVCRATCKLTPGGNSRCRSTASGARLSVRRQAVVAPLRSAELRRGHPRSGRCCLKKLDPWAFSICVSFTADLDQRATRKDFDDFDASGLHVLLQTECQTRSVPNQEERGA
jgi:hypothetical protein